MEINRRAFLRLSGGAATAVVALGAGPGALLAGSPAEASAEVAGAGTPKGVLVDVTRCVGCRACEIACKQWNKNPAFDLINKGVDENPWHLNAQSFTKVHAVELDGSGLQPAFVKLQCMHCAHPACVAACPVGALNKEANGPVIYDEGKCIGCRYCLAACPFGVPAYQWDSNMPWVKKCTFCYDRQAQGLAPACVSTCPTGALQFGDRADMLAEAKRRLQAEPAKYVNQVYGEKEVGGTSWLYLSPVPFEELGMPALGDQPVALNVERAMSLVPPVLLGVAATMTAVYWLGKRPKKADEKKDGGRPGVSG